MPKFPRPLVALPVVLVLLTGFLVLGVASHISALKSGSEITVAARGYDPRDVLLGHYVRIQPELETVLSEEQSDRIRANFGFGTRRFNTVNAWVTLERRSGSWSVIDVTAEKPATANTNDRVSFNTLTRITASQVDDEPLTYTVRPQFDMNRFYANQSDALDIERAIRNNSEVRLIISITKKGDA